MPKGRYSVDIYTEAIDSEFGPGGQVTAENQRIRRLILSRAVKGAPRRSGNLAASHKDGGALKEGRLRLRGEIYNTSDHALFVHEGTTGPIVPNSQFMWVPHRRGMLAKRDNGTALFRVGPKFRKKSVAGQRANPWLARAAEEVMSGY